MRKFVFVLFLFGLTPTIFAQIDCRKQADWEVSPLVHYFSDANLDSAAAVIIKDHRSTEIKVGMSSSKSYSIHTVHKIIKVNTDVGIEKFNKVYIPLHGDAEIVELAVRTITPTGKLTHFNKENLKVLKNVDGYGDYQIFAVEGIVKGGEIEYTFTIKRGLISSGREVFQTDVPVLDARFKLVTPQHYHFATKSYNGFPESEIDTSIEDTEVNFKIVNSIKAHASNIPAITVEEFSSTKASLMRIDFKLDKTVTKFDIINWNSVAKNLFNSIYTTEGRSSAKKFIKQSNIKNLTKFASLIHLEKSIKESFSIQESKKPEYSNPTYVFQNRVCNELGLIRAYLHCLDLLNVRFFIVSTSNRFKGGIDPAFAHGMDTRNIFFYFPQFKKYIMPSHHFMRFGPASENFAGNDALFVQVDHDSFSNKLTYGSSLVKRIKAMSAKENKMGIMAELTPHENMDEMSVKMEYHIQGYRAYMTREMYKNSQQEDLEKFKNEDLLSAIEDPEISSFSVENEDFIHSMDNGIPFIVNLEFTSNSMLDQLGKDLIIPIGKIIGQQSDLYDEKVRKTDITIPYKKEYEYELKLNIPKGYECTGLEKLKISNVVIKDYNKIMRFDSDYTLEGNVLTITIQEDYQVLQLEKEYYDDFRKVINSAADFNKVTLVLVPKEEKVK